MRVHPHGRSHTRVQAQEGVQRFASPPPCMNVQPRVRLCRLTRFYADDCTFAGTRMAARAPRHTGSAVLSLSGLLGNISLVDLPLSLFSCVTENSALGNCVYQTHVNPALVLLSCLCLHDFPFLCLLEQPRLCCYAQAQPTHAKC